MNMVRFYQVAAVVMFGIAGAFLWFCFESVVWYGYVFTFAMAAISGATGVTAWMSAKYEKDYRALQENWQEMRKLYHKLFDQYEELLGQHREQCDKYQVLCDEYEELCYKYQELCDKYQNLFDTYPKRNSRPEE